MDGTDNAVSNAYLIAKSKISDSEWGASGKWGNDKWDQGDKPKVSNRPKGQAPSHSPPEWGAGVPEYSSRIFLHLETNC